MSESDAVEGSHPPASIRAAGPPSRNTRTRLERALDFLVVPEIHAVISNHQDTIRATINFLKHGKFEAAS